MDSAPREYERRGDRPAARHGDFVRLARVVAEATGADERGRTAAVKVQRLACPKAGHRLRELVQRESCLVVRAALASECDQALSVRSERRSRMTPVGDVRVELVGRGRKSLFVAAYSSSVTNEERPGLQQITRRALGELVATRDPHLPPRHADAGSPLTPGVRERDER